jgi:hypothetical protein
VNDRGPAPAAEPGVHFHFFRGLVWHDPEAAPWPGRLATILGPGSEAHSSESRGPGWRWLRGRVFGDGNVRLAPLGPATCLALTPGGRARS